MSAVGQGLPVKGHVDQMRQGDNKDDRAEIDREDSDLPAADRFEQKGQQHCARTSRQHAQEDSGRPEHRCHGNAK